MHAWHWVHHGIRRVFNRTGPERKRSDEELDEAALRRDELKRRIQAIEAAVRARGQR